MFPKSFCFLSFRSDDQTREEHLKKEEKTVNWIRRIHFMTAINVVALERTIRVSEIQNNDDVTLQKNDQRKLTILRFTVTRQDGHTHFIWAVCVCDK